MTLNRRILPLIFLAFLGCEVEDTEARDCAQEDTYFCSETACFCILDSLQETPLSETQALAQCTGCLESGTQTWDPKEPPASGYDRFGGIDDFSGDDDWGTREDGY